VYAQVTWSETITIEKADEEPVIEWRLIEHPGSQLRIPAVCIDDECSWIPRYLYNEFLDWAMKLREA